MATKKTVKPVTFRVEDSPELTLKVNEKCLVCVNGRIPQRVDWHYISCEKCKGTAMK